MAKKIYDGRSNIHRTFFYKHLLITIFFKEVRLIFQRILPTLTYTIAIAQAGSLCPFQKKSAVARLDIVAYKI
jgi:hypothetical protein